METDPVARRLRRSVSVADMRRIARQRVPRGVFDYVDGGAEDERTLRANSDAFASSASRRERSRVSARRAPDWPARM